jgi:hypothetical protein
MKRAKAAVLSGVLVALAASSGAVPKTGAASLAVRNLSYSQRKETPRLPDPVRLREVKGRGLLTQAWINGRGPFNVAIDTGAGLTIVSQNVAASAGLRNVSGRSTVAGLSGKETLMTQAVIDGVALGNPDNVLPGKLQIAVTPNLPSGIDCILDPTDAYAPLGYTIDFYLKEIAAFDSRSSGLNVRQQPADGAVVPWVRDNESNRPFVRLSDGRLALIDSGSEFGLALSRSSPDDRGDSRRARHRDVGGGQIHALRVEPTTVAIGALVLRGVPTDILSGIEKDAPTILGRDALYPFRISFDPTRRLIEIVPSLHDNNQN